VSIIHSIFESDDISIPATQHTNNSTMCCCALPRRDTPHATHTKAKLREHARNLRTSQSSAHAISNNHPHSHNPNIAHALTHSRDTYAIPLPLSNPRPADEGAYNCASRARSHTYQSGRTACTEPQDTKQMINQSIKGVLTKPHKGKEKPHPSPSTGGSKPCVTR